MSKLVSDFRKDLAENPEAYEMASYFESPLDENGKYMGHHLYGDGSSFKSTKLAFDERYLEVIEKHPEEWVQICSNSEINSYSK